MRITFDELISVPDWEVILRWLNHRPHHYLWQEEAYNDYITEEVQRVPRRRFNGLLSMLGITSRYTIEHDYIP